MSMDIGRALTEVRRFKRFVKAFEHLEDVAETLAQADQLLLERQQAVKGAEAQVETAQQRLNEIAQEASAQAAQIIEERAAAESECEQLRAEAEKNAEDITAKAKVALEGLAEEHEQAALELRELRQKITETQAELDDIEPKLAAAREQARKILEGEE